VLLRNLSCINKRYCIVPQSFWRNHKNSRNVIVVKTLRVQTVERLFPNIRAVVKNPRGTRPLIYIAKGHKLERAQGHGSKLFLLTYALVKSIFIEKQGLNAWDFPYVENQASMAISPMSMVIVRLIYSSSQAISHLTRLRSVTIHAWYITYVLINFCFHNLLLPTISVILRKGKPSWNAACIASSTRCTEMISKSLYETKWQI
jgi:hypothetical protein